MLHSWETHQELFEALSQAELNEYFNQYPDELERRDSRDDTPLIAACRSGNVGIVSLLIDLGAKLNVVTNAGDTAFRSAIENHSCETSIAICKLLLDAGADIELRGIAEETPLHKAVSSGKIELVQFLLDCGADINAPREDNETPLMAEMWAKHPNPAMVRLLIERGTNLAQRDSWGRTALQMADQLGKNTAAEILRGA